MPKEPEVIYDFDPRNLPPKLLQAIGLITAAATQTESILQDFIGALLNIDNVQTIALTTNMSNHQKDTIIRTLAELDAPNLKELDKIDDLLDSVREALNKRNTIVHNTFSIHPDTGEVSNHRLRAKRSLLLELKPVSIKEIENDASLIYEAGMDIMRFMISRGLAPYFRTKPLRDPPKRNKKARQKRNKNPK